MNRMQQALAGQGGGPIYGAAAYLYNPTFLEMAALIGYSKPRGSKWTYFPDVRAGCRSVPDRIGTRDADHDPDTKSEPHYGTAGLRVRSGHILDLPMANTREMVAEFVEHARFPPEGVRGFFSVSRSVKYGLDGPVCEEQRKLNRELCLMAQVETREAVDRVDGFAAYRAWTPFSSVPRTFPPAWAFPGKPATMRCTKPRRTSCRLPGRTANSRPPASPRRISRSGRVRMSICCFAPTTLPP